MSQLVSQRFGIHNSISRRAVIPSNSGRPCYVPTAHLNFLAAFINLKLPIMASYKFYLFNQKSHLETYIYLRLAENKKTYKFYTELKIKPADWNAAKGEARKSYTGYSDFNSLLVERQESLRQLHQQLLKEKNFSIERLRLLFYQKFGKVVWNCSPGSAEAQAA